MGHKITSLVQQKRNHQRVNVYLDGEFAFGLSRIVAAWLQVGQELSDEKIAQLQFDDDRESAYQQALKLISYRPRSEAEVRQNLQRHKASEDVIDHIIERLKTNGLIDDASFAQAWVDNRSELRPRSQRALSFELQRRGVSSENIAQAVESIDNEELAYQAALKRGRKLKDLEWQMFRQKLYGFLAQRGFDYEVCSQTIPRVWKEIHATEQTSDEGAYP